MYCVLLFLIFLLGIVRSSHSTGLSSENEAKKIFVYNTYKYNTTIHIVVNDTTEQFLDFYEDSEEWHGHPTRVHVSSIDTISGDHPLFITATQQKGVSSWELPLVVATKTAVHQFNAVSRTLCPHDAGPNITSVNRPSLQITTSSARNVTAAVKVRRVKDFFVEVGKDVKVIAKPSSPKYYYFSFDSAPANESVSGGTQGLPRFNYTIPKSVILMIESEDEICATISIQNNSCPVFDNERDVLYQGYHLTMTTKGGITLTQSMFPQGFYIVFIVRESDEVCTGDADATHTADRTKYFKFRVIATISYKEYVIGALVTLALTLVVAALVALLPLAVSCRSTEVVVLEEDPGPSTSRDGSSNETQPIVDVKDDVSDTLSESIPELPVWFALNQPLTLAGLSRATPSSNSRRSDRYFWISLTVAVVYSLPVVQLLFTYQSMVFQTGDQDLCYYNFLCAHPVGSLSDFNHVYSNVAYVVLGLLFMLQARRRRVDQNMGIPQHTGLFCSMGLALAMEGILSACYHLCPNKMNFQFDSSFMYVIAVLCMVKIYQNRHPDVNASAHSTFMLLALVMALGLFGIVYPSVYFWVFFTILHLSACLTLTLNIYYVGRFKLERGVLSRGWGVIREHGRYAFKPNYTARAVLLALANVANWALAVYGLYEHNKDFARHLLAILMGNAFLYTLFYVCMKLVHRESLRAHTWAYFVGTFVCAGAAVSFFLDSRTKWSQTPAQSRRHNQVCSALQFYDSHDVWHFASAAAMFLYFHMLLTLDDALADTPRDQIPVF